MMASNIRRAIEAVHGGEELTPHDQLLIANEALRLRIELWSAKTDLDVLSRFLRDASRAGKMSYNEGSEVDDIIKRRVL